MGSVFAARDMDWATPHLVAVKTTKLQGIEAERLLRDEARIASQIEHQNVCRVHELGKDGDTNYLVLDYCDGASLHELLVAAPQTKLAPLLAVKIAASVAAGLHAAHEVRGPFGEHLEVIHRDVSPQNVLISSRGHVCLTDFGVAKAQGQAHRPTETGEVKGKASYMAPEQVRSQDIDRRADVFGLGCVLYQSLLGRRPFNGETTVSTLYQILEAEITRPTLIDPNFPQTLEPILMKSLAKDREARYQSAEEFQLALEMWLVNQDALITEHEVRDLLMSVLGPMINERKATIVELARSAPLQVPGLSSGANIEHDTTPPATAFRSDSYNTKPKLTKVHWGLVGIVGLGLLTAIVASSLGAGSASRAIDVPLNAGTPELPHLTEKSTATAEAVPQPALPSLDAAEHRPAEVTTPDRPEPSVTPPNTAPASPPVTTSRPKAPATRPSPAAGHSLKPTQPPSSAKKRRLDTVNPFSN